MSVSLTESRKEGSRSDRSSRGGTMTTEQEDRSDRRRPQAPARTSAKSAHRRSAHMEEESKVKKQCEDGANAAEKPREATTGKRPLRLRITLAGAEGVGKSCLIKRYCEKRFVPRHQPTVGIDYGATRIFVDGREVSVHVFDTSGAPLFREVRNEFYRDTHGIVLVFDPTSRASFDALCEWTKEIYSELARCGGQHRMYQK